MQSLKSFFFILGQLGRGRAFVLVALLFVNSLLEGLGLATLLPLFMVAMGGGIGGSASPAVKAVMEVMRTMGLPAETWALAALAAGALVLREIFSFAILYYAGHTITGIAARMRQNMLRAITAARWPWFQEKQLGRMSITLAQFTNQAAQSMELAMDALAIFLRTFVYIALIVSISFYLAAFVFAAGLALYAPLLHLVRRAQRHSGKFVNASEMLSAYFSDIFSSIKAIKAMGMEHSVQPLFDRYILRLMRQRRYVLLASYGLTALQNITAIILVFSALYIAINWLRISIVEAGLVTGLMLSIVKNLSRSQKRLQLAIEMEPYLRRVLALTESARNSAEHDGGNKRPALAESITFDDVYFSYPGKEVLKGVSFTIPAGKTTVFIGPSGAGKTTIIDLITGLYRPQGGKILVDGTPLGKLDLHAWRSMTGYVPQELILLSGTVRDNITLGAKVADADVWRALEKAGAAEFVSELPNGLDTGLGERGLKLSGGQRQRLSLARALVREPKLLILDEVTSALDPETERRLVERIGGLSGGDITIIAITHTSAWLAAADKVLHLENGKAGEGVPEGRESR